jgi:undecaprenyl-diphosphatase
MPQPDALGWLANSARASTVARSIPYERLPHLRPARHHRRGHGVPARQLHGAPAYRGTLSQHQFGRRLLEDVHRRHQLGAILSLPVYFRRRIVEFVSTFPKGERGDRTIFTHPLSLTLAAFVVTAIPSYLLKKQIGENLESLHIMAWSLLVGGILMWVIDAMFRRPHIDRLEDMNLPRALWIGAVQILSAVFPGTSRSMCTIAAGQVAGLSRSAALEFSFFLSMPTMVVATGYDLLKTVGLGSKDAGDAALAPVVMTAHNWIVLAIGFVVSFIVALAVVAWFMHWVRARGFVRLRFTASSPASRSSGCLRLG